MRMKIIKRNGRAVDYDREKIRVAIEKANKEVKLEERATKEQIKNMIKYIEERGKKRMLVEDIQDIIEEKLMEIGKYELAKKYIVYRYTRTLVRKQNTTDESILALIRNENKQPIEENDQNTLLASRQRDSIAGEVSRDLTKRLLLPEKIVKADEEGVLHFHDADYFVQPIFNSCFINLNDMLEKGTMMNGKKIESPKSFQVACMIMTQIMVAVASNQYGGQSIDLIHLGKYLRKSYQNYQKEMKAKYAGEVSKEILENMAWDRLKAELKSGVQIIQYQINTLMTTNRQSPLVTLFLHLEKDDPYLKENAMIIEEVIRQTEEGMQDDKGVYVTSLSPQLVYVLDDCNNLTGGQYDYLTKLAIQCSIKRKYPYYLSAKKMRENYEGNVFSPMGGGSFLSPWKDENKMYQFEGRFNQGVVTLNLPQIGIVSQGEEEKFWQELDDRLELCKEALMCRHYALLGIKSDISPIHWQYGAISRLKKGESIDKLLSGNYSTISLGYIGLYEVTKLMTGESLTTEKGYTFAKRVMKYLREVTDKWRKETNIGFSLYGTSARNLGCALARKDKEKFGVIKEVTDKGYYTNSYHVDIKEKIDNMDKLMIESEFQKISSGGSISYLDVSNLEQEGKSIDNVIQFIYDHMQYVGLESIS